MNILILGASSGLGMSLSEYYSKNLLCNIICVSSDLGELNKVKNNIKVRYEKNIDIYKCNFLNKSEISSTVKKILSKFKNKIDLIFYSAAIIEPDTNFDNKLNSFDDLIKVNFLAFHQIFKSTYKFINNKYFKSQFIYISSISTIRIRYNNSFYSTSKKVADYYIDGINKKINSKKLNILIVYVGYMDTRLAVNIPNILKTKTNDVCRIIDRNLNNNKKYIYVPSYWYFISIFIKLTPKFIWNALKI